MIRRVLFVDDDPNILQGMKRTMRSLKDQLESDFAENAELALQKMSTTSFDVVISDMRMPGMNGADFLEEVQGLYPQIIRIILSGQSDESLIIKSIGAAHQYLSKPCNSDTIMRTVDRACAIQDHLSDETLKKMVAGLSQLPSLPALYTQLVAELQKEEVSLEQVSHIISQDVALSTKMLQIVNSAFFGLARTVVSVQLAVQHLGFETVKTLVLVVKVIEALPPNGQSGLQMERFLEHSICTGQLAKTICKMEGVDQEFREQALTAGMLHDVGKLIFAHHCAENFASVSTWQKKHGGSQEEGERAMLGATHAHVGGYLLGVWGLPPSIVEAVLYHHRPSQLDFENFSPLTAVHVANVLLHKPSENQQVEEEVLDESYLNQIGKWERASEWQSLVEENVST